MPRRRDRRRADLAPVADERLRELERRWRASGTREDEVAYLRACLRSGRLVPEQVELCRDLGHYPARVALEDRRRCPDRFVQWWKERRGPWGRELFVRSAVAVALSVVDEWTTVSRVAVRAAERWLVCPCDDHAEKARDAGRAARAVARAHGRLGELEPARIAKTCSRAAWAAWHPHRAREWYRLARACAPDVHLRDLLMQPTVRDELVPWALGYGDPVWSRVTKRGTIPLEP